MEEASKAKLPLNITFYVYQYPAPNLCWYDVTALLSWEQAKYTQPMDTCHVPENELEDIKEATCFLIGKRFDIRTTTTIHGTFPEQTTERGR